MRRPTIGGTPVTVVSANSSYSFVPIASDPDGDRLTFSISNKPGWASFNTGTGRLAGTPGDADVGVSGTIFIRATDGQRTVPLPAFSITVQADSFSAAVTTATVATATVAPAGADWISHTDVGRADAERGRLAAKRPGRFSCVLRYDARQLCAAANNQ